MDKAIFQDVPEEKRAEVIHDNAAGLEEIGYMKRFSATDLTEMKSQLSEISIEQNDLEEERKELVADLTKKIKELQSLKKVTLRRLKEKAEHVKEVCYKFTDEKERMVGYYNSIGELVYSRPMGPEEMQLSIPMKVAK